jgi:beta-glucosidase
LPDGFLPLLRAVHGTGTPTVAVLVNGTPISSAWMKTNIPAIIEAWYGGMEGGTAIAETLFGDVNPGGKLPWTYPRVEAGPAYYNVKPGEFAYDESVYLWPFGYGLSYTSFKYSNLRISPKSSGTGVIMIRADVKNIGDRKGDAVVELYLHDLESSVPVPVKSLKGFERVPLNPGESKCVTFALKPDDISLLDANLEPIVEPGAFEVLIGESSADIVLRDTFEISKPIKAAFKVENLAASKTKVEPLESFEVRAVVVGTGGLEEGDVRLMVDGRPVQSRKLCLAAGEKRELTLVCKIEGAGTHRVALCDSRGLDISVEKR